MKKITKFLVVALSLVLLVGAIVGVSASAADSETPTYSATSHQFIISANVSYAGKLHLRFAIDPTYTEFMVKEVTKVTGKKDSTVENYSDGSLDLITCTIGGKTYTLTPSAEKFGDFFHCCILSINIDEMFI